jgi:hypothetical protein
LRIVWNSAENRFEAQFDTQSWQACKDAVQTAGFHTTGPPAWVWFSIRSIALTRLRENKPPSGLTITPEALEKYKTLKAQDDANLAVKVAYKKVRKELKKEQQLNTLPKLKLYFEPSVGFECVQVEPRKSTFVLPYVPPPPTLLCHLCQTPVYEYECQEPVPLCLDCEFSENNA